jgi:hypothetical protein
MNNLQELYDTFLNTTPSDGKIKAATTMMIHVSKALNMASNEEITTEYFVDIPRSIDEFFYNTPPKAMQDKAILSEMIGRVGPTPELRGLLENLLADEDENVRQYALHSLEFYGMKDPDAVLPYIEKYIKGVDPVMSTMAVHLTGKISCSAKFQIILNRILTWYKKGEYAFVKEVLKRMIQLRTHGLCRDFVLTTDEIVDWCKQNFSDNKELINSILNK